MLHVFSVMFHVFWVMSHVFPVMLDVFLVIFHMFRVMLQVFLVMLHVFRLMLQETCATLHETQMSNKTTAYQQCTNRQKQSNSKNDHWCTNRHMSTQSPRPRPPSASAEYTKPSLVRFYFDDSGKQAEAEEVTPQSNYVAIYYNGWCVWEPRYELSVIQCTVDVTWFPYDKQTCQLVFVSWLLENTQLHLSPDPDFENQSYYIKSNVWEFTGT